MRDFGGESSCTWELAAGSETPGVNGIRSPAAKPDLLRGCAVDMRDVSNVSNPP